MDFFVPFNSNADERSTEKLQYLSQLGNSKECYFADSHIKAYQNTLSCRISRL